MIYIKLGVRKESDAVARLVLEQITTLEYPTRFRFPWTRKFIPADKDYPDRWIFGASPTLEEINFATLEAGCNA